MGLKSHKEHGAKAWLRANTSALQPNDPFRIGRVAMGSGAHALAIVDANVALMAVPQSITSLGEYVSCLGSQLARFVDSFDSVVLCYDDLSHVPVAKLAEQRRRDRARAAAASKKRTRPLDDGVAVGCPGETESVLAFGEAGGCVVGDSYTLDDIVRAPDCHSFTADRTKRYRFADEVAQRLAKRFPSVVFDGIDVRGADRPVDADRVPDFYCGAVHMQSEDAFACPHAALVAALRQGRSEPIGEADLKLWNVEQVVRDLLPGRSLVSLHATIDTDSIPVQLLGLASKGAAAATPNAQHLSYVSFRTPQKDGSAVFELLDVLQLQSDLSALCGSDDHPRVASLFAATAALGGCDFVSPPSCFRTSELLTAACRLVRVGGDCTAVPREHLLGACLPLTYEAFLRKCCHEAAQLTSSAGGRNSAKRALDLCNPDPALMTRAAWCTRYWSGGAVGGGLGAWGFDDE